MTRDDWLELTVLERKKYNYLTEVQDLTRQLAEVDSSEKARLNALTEEDRNRAEALRRGEQSPGEDGERIFLEQAGKTRRLLEQVVELDRRTSVRMAGEQSFYHK